MFGRNDRGRLNFATFVTIFVAALPSVGLATSDAENKVHFAWVRGPGAESCPAEATLAKIVAARLGRAPFSRDSARFIEGVVERTPSGWSAHIRMSEDGSILGTRELTSEGPDCSAITAASVLAIAIGIDPDAALGIVPHDTPVVPPASALPEAEKHHEPIEKPRTPEPPPATRSVHELPASAPLPFRRLTVSPRGILGIALLPRAAPGFALMTGLEGQRWEGALGMFWLPEVSTSNGEFAFGITAITLGGCMNAVRARRLSLSACLAMHGGAIHKVVASEIYKPLDVQHGAWFAGAPSLRARILIVPWFSIDAGAELVIPLLPRDFAIHDQHDPVFAMPPLGLTTFFGPTLSIP